MRYDQQSSIRRKPHCYVPIFVIGMIRIISGQGKVICKNGHCFSKRNTVLEQVGFGLGVVPFEFHLIAFQSLVP